MPGAERPPAGRRARGRTCGLLAVVLLFLAGCAPAPDPVIHRQFFALGTLVDVTFHGVDAARAAAAGDELERLLGRLHRDWHAWQPGLLQETNRRLATLEEFTVDPELLPLLQEAGRLSLASDGLFNPLIGELVALWGFHADERPNGPPPSAAALRQALARLPAVTDLEWRQDRLRSRNPAARYDLGAIAKGFAVDRGIELLRARGVDNAILNAGGDLRAIGRHGDRDWHIGIRDPRGSGVFAAVDLADGESVFTSGDYERYFDHDGTRHHHIIDPRSGYPANAVTSVTVIDTSAAAADAAATALFVAGPDAWHAVARRMGVRLVMLVDRQGAVHLNPAMQRRVRFEGHDVDLRVSEPL